MQRWQGARHWCVPAVVAAVAAGLGCGAGTDVGTTPLVDLFDSTVVAGTVSGLEPPPRTEWQFGNPAPADDPFADTGGVEAGPGIADLAIQGGRLVGRSTTETPILRLERESDLEIEDDLHAIEVRLRVSDGTTVQIATRSEDDVDLGQLPDQVKGSPFRITSPLVPGDELQTYTLTSPTPIAAADIQHLILVPTDVADAEFEIESVRVVFRREHLASIPSGIGWQGLNEIYQEVLVARAPETLTFEVTLGSRPWLDLSLGTVEPDPLTFSVGIATGDSGDGAETLLAHTLTRPQRWERRAVDLSAFAGDTVRLTLSLDAERDGVIGFWGAPVVRTRGSRPTIAGGEPAPSSAGAPASMPRGVILIQADTLRRDHLDVYGHDRETAPTVRRWAETGALFRGATAQATWTKVSTPSMMTSLYPLSHGVRDFPDRLPAAAETLAEQYRAAGYATVAYSSVLFTGRFTNLHQGFEELHESGSVDEGPSSKTARAYVDRAMQWIEHHRDVPFFVFLHVFDPHDPYEPRQPFADRWADRSTREQHLRHAEEVKEFIDSPLLRQFGMPDRGALERAGIDPDAYVQHDMDWYDGSIRGMDAELHRLTERLRELGLEDDVVIVFTSDHGEEFLEHGRMFHGQSVYNEQTQVPLVIRWPAVIPAGVEIDTRVQLIDLMPTLLDLSGLHHPEGLQGHSLVPLLQVPTSQDVEWTVRPAFTEKAITTGGAAPPPADTEAYAVLDDRWLLIHNTARSGDRPEFELFDTTADPLNHNNLAEQEAAVVERLQREIERWRRVASAARLPDDTEATEGLSQQELERLRSLGYVR